jgi:hypothetical protein
VETSAPTLTLGNRTNESPSSPQTTPAIYHVFERRVGLPRFEYPVSTNLYVELPVDRILINRANGWVGQFIITAIEVIDRPRA